MHEISNIIFYKDDYRDEEALMKAVFTQINILLSAGYLCTCDKVKSTTSENKYAIIVAYCDSNVNAGSPYPYFLTPDEALFVKRYHIERESKLLQQKLGELQNDELQLQEMEKCGNEIIAELIHKKKDKDDDNDDGNRQA